MKICTWARALRLRDDVCSLMAALSMRCMPGSLAHSDATEPSTSCGYPSTGLSLGWLDWVYHDKTTTC